MVKLRAVLHQGQPQQIKGHDWLWQGVTCLIAGSSGGIPVAGVRGGRADARPQLLGEGGWQLRPPPPASGPTLIPLAVYTLHLARSTLGSSLPKLLRRLLRPGNFLVAAPASLPVPGPCGSCSHRGLGSGLPC